MRRHQPSTGLAAACLMGQASAAPLPRLDGTVVECQIAGEDRRAIMLARTLTEIAIADPGKWRRSVSGYLLETLTAWIVHHGGVALSLLRFAPPRDQIQLRCRFLRVPCLL